MQSINGKSCERNRMVKKLREKKEIERVSTVHILNEHIRPRSLAIFRQILRTYMMAKQMCMRARVSHATRIRHCRVSRAIIHHLY